MQTIELIYPHTFIQEDLPETIAAIGFFDGIHKGHQKVIQTASQKAKEQQMETAVITFYPHPSVVLSKGTKDVKYITPFREKQEILEALGVDRLYIITFDISLASLAPEQFIKHFIIGLNIKHLVAGFDFTYGHKGKGNMQVIADHAKGFFDYTTIDKVTSNEQKVSSTRIRELLQQGDMEEANYLLGRPLSTYGTVVEGEQRGRTIGYPTANLRVSPDALLPKNGVYAVKVQYRGDIYEAMASIGVKPTFTSDIIEPIVEVHIFDVTHNLYGEELKVFWYKFIRNEEKFSGVDELVEEITNDEKIIRQYFAK
ncbi:bifunctional riboflavin kinase/FAD synthetase [Oceanobacillus halotolerans]|uniref:bifunctional riboflavin kinase/FAD synthetase n=1 Tax=Oceanobacillus halotolerans TaxID=2663380 RepID=UPI0013DCD23D|nr:bifunctional riboflavin kinase/FAD synthetase [Oceanobacillus halotolerans]